jgi:xylulokinase
LTHHATRYRRISKCFANDYRYQLFFRSTTMSLIGLDIGTTGCKAIVFAEDGAILAQAAREYSILTPHPTWAEQHAEGVWNLAWAALAEAVAQVENDPPVAMALSCQGEAVIPVDADGKALRPAILGMDTRTGAETQWLADQFGPENLFNRTGMPTNTVNTLPKLLWLQHNEPELWQSADQFLLYEDFFLRRLSGQATISHCLASRTQMYDLTVGTWADDLLAECNIEKERLSPLAPSDGIVGKLRPELARELGLRHELLLVSGGHDQACAALGSGVTQTGLAMVSSGTAEVVEVAMETPALDKALREGDISVYRHVVPGLYLAMTLNHSGGLSLRWYRDTLGKWELDQAKMTGQDAYDLLLDDAPPGPTNLLFLPHFSGSGTPNWDNTSKGAVLGLTFAATKSTLAKALVEGLTFELRNNLDLLRNIGVTINELHAVGGGAKSNLWLQLKADICQIPLRIPQVTEAACLGAALLAGVGVGIYPDFDTAVAQTVHFERRIQPKADSVAAYNTRYELYQQVYPTLIELQRRL